MSEVETVGWSVSWIIDVIAPQTTNQSSRSPNHPLHPPLWVMVTPVIGFTLWNNGTEEQSRKNETIIHNGNVLCSGFRQTHIYSERRTEAEGAAGTLQRCFIEFVRLFPSLRPNPFLYLFYPSHTHTNKLKMMGFSLHPRARSTPAPD